MTTQPMKPEIKEQWLAALRSGEYEQTSGRLKGRQGGFCCLGVLCDIATKAGIGRWQDAYFVTDTKYGPELDNHYLPPIVMEWAGLDRRQNPKVGESFLSSLNDTGYSFREIANQIERYL